MDLNSTETLREYNSLVRFILNNVRTIYNQHYEITRLNMVYNNSFDRNRSNIGLNRTDRTRTDRTGRTGRT